MARDDSNHTTRLSQIFTDPILRAAFAAAEDDGQAPALVETDRRPSLTGDAAEQVPVTSRRMLVEA